MATNQAGTTRNGSNGVTGAFTKATTSSTGTTALGVHGDDASKEAKAARSTSRLDALVRKSPEELLALYTKATVPPLADVRGNLRGRMLAVTALPAWAAPWVRRFEGSAAFPWLGKSFYPESSATGEGVNRIYFGALRMFPFVTHIGRSRAGNFDALQLNYDLPENPFFIRAIKDEIRELAPGLYLGQAHVEVKGKTTLVLYFGLENPALVASDA
jgi:hypothetical protein